MSVRFRSLPVLYVRHSQPHITTGVFVQENGIYWALNLKAQNARIMLMFLHLCLRELQPAPGSFAQELELARGCLAAVLVFYDASERAGRYLSQETADKLVQAGESYLATYEMLARVAQLPDTDVPPSPGRRGRWKVIPKHHETWA
jgi:hypothetical protein